jgi:chromosome segregation ATPase
MRLVNAATKQHVDTIRVETKKMQADLNERIAEAKSLAMEGIRQIQEKYDTRILKTSQRFERQIQDPNQERTKLEKAEGRAISKIERCDAEIQASKAQKDSGGERRWKDEKETWKREASTLKKSIEALDKQIEQTESQKKTEIANIRTEFNAQSEDAMKDVRELEAIRESKTQLSQQEAKSMEESTSTILSQLDTLTKKKRAALEELDKIGTKEQRRKIALAHAPFYLACFKTEAKRKYVVYPPSVAGSMKATTKLKGMFGMSKLGSLFQPRSKALSNVLNQVVTLADRDPVFEKDLYDAGMQASILKSADSRERILKGLSALRNEEWISVNEVQVLEALLKS